MLLGTSTPRSAARSLTASVIVHVTVLAGVLSLGRLHPVYVVNSTGTPSGKRLDLVYLPGRVSASAVSPPAKRKLPAAAKLAAAAAALPLPLPSPAASTPAAPADKGSSSVSDAADQGKSSDSEGDGELEQIALTTYSPSPAPDLSILPRGVQGDVVVDITIAPDGTISDLAVVKTLGYGIESSVVATVRTWIFQPATKDGMPIASEQELQFHFGRPGF